jgi:glycolate oxidase iron-sulfur subunit
MGLEGQALPLVKANIDAWLTEAESPGGLDAIIVNTSGCGTSLKAYGHALRLDPAWKDKAARVSALTKDITEFITGLGPQPPQTHRGMRVVYHSACSMQHGQRIVHQPINLYAQPGSRWSRCRTASCAVVRRGFTTCCSRRSWMS